MEKSDSEVISLMLLLLIYNWPGDTSGTNRAQIHWMRWLHNDLRTYCGWSPGAYRWYSYTHNFFTV